MEGLLRRCLVLPKTTQGQQQAVMLTPQLWKQSQRPFSHDDMVMDMVGGLVWWVLRGWSGREW